MLIKNCCFLIGLCLLEGCTQQPKIGWKHIGCEESDSIRPYTLESLDRNYACKKAQGEV